MIPPTDPKLTFHRNSLCSIVSTPKNKVDADCKPGLKIPRVEIFKADASFGSSYFVIFYGPGPIPKRPLEGDNPHKCRSVLFGQLDF